MSLTRLCTQHHSRIWNSRYVAKQARWIGGVCIGGPGRITQETKGSVGSGNLSLGGSRHLSNFSNSNSEKRIAAKLRTSTMAVEQPTHSCRTLFGIRNGSTSAPISASPATLIPPSSIATFKSLGIEPTIIDALRQAFPNVKRPTEVQEQLINELIGGRDILLKDDTGSGKSFGLVLGLLTKPRVVLEDPENDIKGQKESKRVITSLFIVPHRDLAYQLQHWIERIVSKLGSSPPLASIVQVLVRGTDRSISQSIKELQETPPHILICTPQAFLEVYKEESGKGKEALRVDTLSCVVVDEVDYLVRTAARKDPNKSFKKAYEKALKKIQMHPGPTREVLDEIYKRRIELSQNPYDPEESESGSWNSVEEWRNDIEAEEEIPQLVLSSATLRVHLKNYLFEESGWLNPYNLAKIVANHGVLGPLRKRTAVENIRHSILVVSDTGVRNVEGAIVDKTGSEVAQKVEAEEEVVDLTEDDYNERYEKTTSPFNVISMETIAAAFALDVPSVGLLVVPSDAPVERAVYELRNLGVNAVGLDLVKERYLLDARGANPTLLVATLATTRGLDLPLLTHVFLLGIPEGRSVTGRTVDAYLHISGRVGRFGGSGRVISIVEEKDSPKMLRILDTLYKKPVAFEHWI